MDPTGAQHIAPFIVVAVIAIEDHITIGSARSELGWGISHVKTVELGHIHAIIA